MALWPPFTAQFSAGSDRSGGPAASHLQREWLLADRDELSAQSFFKGFTGSRVLPSIERASGFGFYFQSFTEFTNATDGVVNGPPLEQVGLNMFQRLSLIEPEPGLKLAYLISTEFVKSGLVGNLDKSVDTRQEIGFPNPLTLAQGQADGFDPPAVGTWRCPL